MLLIPKVGKKQCKWPQKMFTVSCTGSNLKILGFFIILQLYIFILCLFVFCNFHNYACFHSYDECINTHIQISIELYKSYDIHEYVHTVEHLIFHFGNPLPQYYVVRLLVMPIMFYNVV